LCWAENWALAAGREEEPAVANELEQKPAQKQILLCRRSDIQACLRSRWFSIRAQRVAEVGPPLVTYQSLKSERGITLEQARSLMAANREL